MDPIANAPNADVAVLRKKPHLLAVQLQLQRKPIAAVTTALAARSLLVAAHRKLAAKAAIAATANVVRLPPARKRVAKDAIAVTASVVHLPLVKLAKAGKLCFFSFF